MEFRSPPHAWAPSRCGEPAGSPPDTDCACACGLAAVPVLAGDDALRRELDRCLRHVTHRGGVLLVEGPAGAGRSRLLRQAHGLAAEAGFAVAHGTADEVLRTVPLAPLVSALAPGDLRDGAAGDAWSLDLLHARLTDRLRHGPLLVTLDDLQWADAATLAALRTLVPRLADQPLWWVLARRCGRHGRASARLFALLREREGVRSVRLGPLSEEAVARCAERLLGAPPAPELLRLAGAAEGNPAALSALLEGWREEGAVRVEAGTARLTGAAAQGQPPRRFGALIRARARDLSPATRLLVDVAAVTGPWCVPEELAQLLATPVAALLPRLREALAAGLLAWRGDAVGFRREPVRLALLATVPEPLRGALHRQAAEMVLARGGPLPAAATHLLHGARPGDRRAVAVLAEAAERTLPAQPELAARLARRGLELGPPDDELRARLLDATVAALTRCGPLPRAVTLAGEALARPLPAATAARVGLGRSTALLLSGRPGEAAAAADRALADAARLGDAAAATRLRHEARTVRCHARAASGRMVGVASSAGVLGARAEALRRRGRLDEALCCARRAVRLADGTGGEPWWLPATLPLAAVLVQRRDAEAHPVVGRLAERWSGEGTAVLNGVPGLLRAVLALAHGDPERAAAQARDGLAAAGEGAAAWWVPTGWELLAEVALRRGDLAAAERHAERLATALRPLTGGDAAAGRARGTYLTARLAAARAEHDTAAAALRELRAKPATLRGLLAEEPAAAAWLVRTGLSVGDRATAQQVVRTVTRLALVSPGAAAVWAAARHAHGVLHGDGAALAGAAEQHRDAWARASAAEDLGVLHSRDASREQAVASLERALAGYGRLDARRDAARVRRRLRRLGVRRRPASGERRPATGWAALTDTERAVAAAVAQGLTNRQVAVQMFLSPHTVGFHLRQIFRKLGIRSRVDLARLHARPGDPAAGAPPADGHGRALEAGGGAPPARGAEWCPGGGTGAPDHSPGVLSGRDRGVRRGGGADGRAGHGPEPPTSHDAPAVIAERATTMRSGAGPGARPRHVGGEEAGSAPQRAAHRRAAPAVVPPHLTECGDRSAVMD